MTFWLIIGALSLVTILIVLWPFLRSRTSEVDGTRETLLAALEKAEEDQSDGSMRNEIARRLIAHDREHKRAQKHGGKKLGWVLAVLAIIFIPFGAVGIYAFEGAYALIDLQAEDKELRQTIARVEARLAEKPEDWRGWSVIAPVYRSRGQFDKASAAFGNAIKYKPNITDDERSLWQSNRAELMFIKDEGQFSREIEPIIIDAVRADPTNSKALYFDALFTEQFKPAEVAILKWQRFSVTAESQGRMILKAEADRRIARLEMLENQKDVAPDQNTAILGMVSQLETRLLTEGGNADEWIRLVNAFGVLKNRTKFTEALKGARAALAEDAEALAMLERMETEILKRDFGE